MFADKDVWIHKDGSLEYDPHSDYGTFDKFKEAHSMVRTLERGLAKGHVVTLEYGGRVRRALGAGYGTVRYDPETKGAIISYPARRPGRAAHEWGHVRLARRGEEPKGKLAEEKEATRLAIHALRGTGRYTEEEREDLIRGLATWHRNGKEARVARATAFVRKVEREPLERAVPEEWEKEWAKEAGIRS